MLNYNTIPYRVITLHCIILCHGELWCIILFIFHIQYDTIIYHGTILRILRCITLLNCITLHYIFITQYFNRRNDQDLWVFFASQPRSGRSGAPLDTNVHQSPSSQYHPAQYSPSTWKEKTWPAKLGFCQAKLQANWYMYGYGYGYVDRSIDR